VKHVAENHGGSVSVDSELGRGTTFEVRLPTA
jgi:two-component system sensor histidine kinase SenX3